MYAQTIVERLAGRSGVTEADIQSDVRALLLYGGLELDERDLVVLESPTGGGRRIDIEVGSTVIEVKKSLEGFEARARAAEQLAGYMAARSEETGARYAGILTDGAIWELHHAASNGTTRVVNELHLRNSSDETGRLIVWLEGVMATARGLRPTPTEIRRRMGSESSGFALEVADLGDIYAQCKNDPEIALKRELWSRLLRSALGSHFPDTDALFVLHTYLVVSAELIAHAALGLPIIGQPSGALLRGEVFEAAQVGGVVEADFFDWPARVPAGDRFVQSLARRVSRFDWTNVDHDVLKALYESVIDAETRKQLGEYYTADWLAEGVVQEVVGDPLRQRVLDPACGSGTFLFWAVRRYLDAANAAGMSNSEALRGVVDHVAGVDLHPVAVALARVTYLLALGECLRGERTAFSIPVYLGDSIRWEEDESLLANGGISIPTTDGAELFARVLYFPERVVADAGRFDQLVADLARRASERERGTSPPRIGAVLRRLAIHPDDEPAVESAYRILCALHDDGRDHIWGYYVRNIARPLWFSRPDNQVDVLIGNPPWLSYRFMSKRLQQLYRRMSSQRGLWAGGNVSTHQDLSDLFVARCVEQYLRPGGRFGFVLPAAALTRGQFEGFRRGYFEAPTATTTVAFAEPWDLRAVRPDLFPVPACVVLGRRSQTPVAMPRVARRFTGHISSRGTRWSDALSQLQESQLALDGGVVRALSPYAERFFQGAVLIPRMLVCAQAEDAGPLGAPAGTDRVRSLRSRLEKPPWKWLPSLDGVIERQFLFPVFFGANIAPFRVTKPLPLAVIPWEGGRLLAGADDELDQYPGLARWWRDAEVVWEANRSASTRLSLRDQVDYYGKLRNQFPTLRHRLLYTKSGNRLTACRIEDPRALVDHTLYWAPLDSVEEGCYLAAVLNSDAVHGIVEPLMSEGLFGKRHIDKYAFAAGFPVFDPADPVHARIAAAGRAAERVSAAVPLDSAASFQSHRKIVRSALHADGIAAQIEELVQQLLTTDRLRAGG